jgi:hypothetical protein
VIALVIVVLAIAEESLSKDKGYEEHAEPDD